PTGISGFLAIRNRIEKRWSCAKTHLASLSHTTCLDRTLRFSKDIREEQAKLGRALCVRSGPRGRRAGVPPDLPAVTIGNPVRNACSRDQAALDARARSATRCFAVCRRLGFRTASC